MDAIPIVANPEIVVGAPDNKQLQETSCILEIDLENGVVPSAPEAISNNETSEKPKVSLIIGLMLDTDAGILVKCKGCHL